MILLGYLIHMPAFLDCHKYQKNVSNVFILKISVCKWICTVHTIVVQGQKYK